MHTIIPHVHHDQLSDEEHQEAHLSAENWLDYIELFFHTDMGDGHLDHFESGQGLDFDLTDTKVVTSVIPFNFDQVCPVSGELSFIIGEYYLKDDPFPDPPIYSSFSLRGPPTIS